MDREDKKNLISCSSEEEFLGYVENPPEGISVRYLFDAGFGMFSFSIDRGRVIKRIEKLKDDEPLSVKALFEGKELSIPLEKFKKPFLHTLTEGIESAEGPLKDAIYELMIARYELKIKEDEKGVKRSDHTTAVGKTTGGRKPDEDNGVASTNADELRKRIEAAIVSVFLDINPIREYYGRQGTVKGLLPAGIVIDALMMATKEPAQFSVDKSVYGLKEYAGSEKFEADVLDSDGKWQRVSTGGPSAKTIQGLIDMVDLFSARLRDRFSALVSEGGVKKELLDGTVADAAEGYYQRDCVVVKDHGHDGMERRKLQPYEIPWYPMYDASYDKFAEYGIRFSDGRGSVMTSGAV